MNNSVLISIVMVCYNHGKYISDAIHSIFEQTHANFELIVINNSSSDETFQILNRFKDSRMKIYTLENYGPSYAFNFGIRVSSGDFLCFISADDFYERSFLYNSLCFINEESKEIVFSYPKLIGEDGEKLSNDSFPTFFNTKTINKYDFFRKLFYQTNFICAPSAFFRREVFKKVGFFKNSLIQLQDYDYWLRSVCICDVGFLDFFGVNYRIRSGNQNLSTIGNNSRTELELVRVLEDVFLYVSQDFLIGAFPEYFNKSMRSEDIIIAISKLYINHSNMNIQRLGFQKISRFIDEDNAIDIIKSNSNFSITEYFEVASYFGGKLLL